MANAKVSETCTYSYTTHKYEPKQTQNKSPSSLKLSARFFPDAKHNSKRANSEIGVNFNLPRRTREPSSHSTLNGTAELSRMPTAADLSIIRGLQYFLRENILCWEGMKPRNQQSNTTDPTLLITRESGSLGIMQSNSTRSQEYSVIVLCIHIAVVKSRMRQK